MKPEIERYRVALTAIVNCAHPRAAKILAQEALDYPAIEPIDNAGELLEALAGLRDLCEQAGMPCDRANELLERYPANGSP